MKTFLPLILSAGICTGLFAQNKVFNVKDYGATGDGKTLDHPAINKTIDAAAAAGGGMVIVPPGNYLCGSIHLQSNITLQIEKGATITGAPQTMNVYDPIEPYDKGGYQDGGHCYFHNSLIWGENLHDVSLIGEGTIQGGGLVNTSAELDNLVGYNGTKDPKPQPASKPLPLGDKAVCFKLCKNIQIKNLTILHGGWFAILLTGCDDGIVDSLTIDTNRDGMDLDCCRRITVNNCRVNSPNDDGICPKSTYVLGEIRVTEDLHITNCQVSGFLEGTLLDDRHVRNVNGTGRIKFGTESSGGFRNCQVDHCTFLGCRGFALEMVDGGIMENITVKDLKMKDIYGYAIAVMSGNRNRTPNLTRESQIRNISISDVFAEQVSSNSGIQITGQNNQRIENVHLNNIKIQCNGGGTKADAAKVPRELGSGYPEPIRLGIMPAYGLFARHVEGLFLNQVKFSFLRPDLRPAIKLQDVKNSSFDTVQAQTAPGVNPAVFQNADGAEIKNSPDLQIK